MKHRLSSYGASALGRWPAPLGTAIFLGIPLFLACGVGGEPGQGASAEHESIPSSTLESEDSAPRPTSPRIASENQVARPLSISDMGYNRGSSEAPVKVLEVSDFGCGYCRRFHEDTYPDIRKVYLDGGFVEWKFIPFVLGRFPNGLQAAIAGECAGEQDQFFPMMARLFSEQGGWRDSDEPYNYFSRLASEEGLDVARFDNCVEGGWREDRVRANIRLGQQVGARGTPFFVIDGIPIPGAVSFQDFRKIVDAALIQRGVTPPSR